MKVGLRLPLGWDIRGEKIGRANLRKLDQSLASCVTACVLFDGHCGTYRPCVRRRGRIPRDDQLQLQWDARHICHRFVHNTLHGHQYCQAPKGQQTTSFLPQTMTLRWRQSLLTPPATGSPTVLGLVHHEQMTTVVSSPSVSRMGPYMTLHRSSAWRLDVHTVSSGSTSLPSYLHCGCSLSAERAQHTQWAY